MKSETGREVEGKEGKRHIEERRKEDGEERRSYKDGEEEKRRDKEVGRSRESSE